MMIIFLLIFEAVCIGGAFILKWFSQLWLLPKQQWWLFSVILLASQLLLLCTTLRLFDQVFRITSFWLVILWLMILSAFVTGLIYILGKWVAIAYFDYLLRAVFILSLLSLVTISLYNAYTPVVRYAKVYINKPLLHPVRVAVASDLHLGELFGNPQIKQLTQIVQQEKADILLMPGDVIDDTIAAYQQKNMHVAFSELAKSLPYGSYATLGNHDVYRQTQEISQVIREANIHLLNDAVLKIDIAGQPIWIVGRLDDHIQSRMTTEKLLAQVDQTQPIFLMDHRPTSVLKHSQLAIDLQVSGHTHKGQIFPANYIVNMLNRLGYGLEKIGRGYYLTTSGFGFWGVPFRLGSQSEVWIIDVYPQQ